ncbi:MAG TPA: hypothetical protein PKM41_01410 [Deltaproteobacteria bacterium]|nr:hypothetical protein [Deltaproteobacteria bacterium]HOI07016.1 hypothetical protein [Deltaproteobacteria bacterium]
MGKACNSLASKPTGPGEDLRVSPDPLRTMPHQGIFGASGLTVVEMTIVVIIAAAVVCIAAPAISGYMDDIDNAEAISRLTSIELCLDKYYAEHGTYPDSLGRIGKGDVRDPWGRAYVYQLMPEDRGACRPVARNAREVRMINTDYDLYSPGKDGKTDLCINRQRSWDDILRAYNGSYIGLAGDIL